MHYDVIIIFGSCAGLQPLTISPALADWLDWQFTVHWLLEQPDGA